MDDELICYMQIGSPDTVLFMMSGITYPSAGYRIERRHSSISCIEYVRKGAGTVISDGRAHKITAGDAYYLEEGHDQRYYADQSNPWEKIWVNFSGALARRITECYGIGGRVHYPSLPLGDLLERMLALAQNPSAEIEKEATLLLHEMLYRLSREVRADETDPRALAIRAYLDNAISRPISIADVAAAVGISPATVNRVFRATYGLTPYAYLAERRIEAAKQLLRSTSLSVRSIAAHLAFADEFYFSYVFKKHAGISPGRYRRT